MGSHVTAVRYLSYPIWVRRHVGSALKPATVMLVDHIVGRPHVLGADGSKLASSRRSPPPPAIFRPIWEAKRRDHATSLRCRTVGRTSSATQQEIVIDLARHIIERVLRKSHGSAARSAPARAAVVAFFSPVQSSEKTNSIPCMPRTCIPSKNPSSSIGSPGWQCRLPAPGAALPN
jgi:hypothetical protein